MFRRSRLLALCLVFGLASAAQAVPLELSMVPALKDASPDGNAKLELVRMAVVGGRLQPEKREVETKLPGQLKLDLPEGTWEIRLRSPAHHAQPLTLHLPPSGAKEKMQWWPLVELKGVLRWPATEKAPTVARARFGLGPGNKDGPRGEVECPVDSAGKFTCPVPQAKLDLRIRAATFVSHYFWGLDLSQAAARQLSTLALRPGASLSGWVLTSEGGALPADLVVAASPIGVDPKLSADLAVKAKPAKNGFFHLEALPPGQHNVMARAVGWADGAVAVNIIERAEAELREPLVITPPLEITVVVDPPMSPDDTPWLLGFQAIDKYRQIGEAERREPMAPSGLWQGKGFQPKSYLVILYSPASMNRVLSREVNLATEPLPIQLSVKMVGIEGSVTVGGTPIAAKLSFGGKYAATRIAAESDDEGNYRGQLPRFGKWEVAVEAPALSIESVVDVDVPEARGNKPARVDVELPDTRMAGRVVDAQGKPLRAFVTFEPEQRRQPMSIPTQDNGKFELLAMPADTVYLVRAKAMGKLESQVERIDLAANAKPPDLELVLQELRDVVGKVVDAAGYPVPGVDIRVVPSTEPSASTRKLQTAGDGGFTVKVPAETREVIVRYLAPGYLMGAEKRLLTTAPLIIEVHQNGGTLHLDSLLAPADSERYLFLDGIQISLGRWLQVQGVANNPGSPLEVPGLKPGFYQLCDCPTKDASMWSLGVADRSKCTEGFLMPNGNLKLGSQ